MLVSSILGPGTIFLMVVGALNISFTLETYVSFCLVFLPVLIFVVSCLCCKIDTQLLLAQIIGTFFALLMMAVIVGTAMQIKKDGVYSPHSIFLVTVIASFFSAALLHPKEFSCIIPGVLYFLAIPCMYMLLTIYSVCNLHIISWGTREIPKNEPTTDSEKKSKLLDENCSLSCGNVCKFFCCPKPSYVEEVGRMRHIEQKLDDIIGKMNEIKTDNRSSIALENIKQEKNLSLFLEEEICAEDFDLPEEYAKMKSETEQSWLNDRSLQQAVHDRLDSEEEHFWRELITKYLSPLSFDQDYKSRLNLELKRLRNRSCFAFFMLNGLFILIVLLLQLKKDCLHIEWPVGPKVNRTFKPCTAEDYEKILAASYNTEDGRSMPNELFVLSRLQLEPIGLIFLIFFMTLLLVQFSAMIMHRFGTISHILASTKLPSFLCKKKITKFGGAASSSTNFDHNEPIVEMVKEMQSIRIEDDEENGVYCVKNENLQPISRRKVVENLETAKNRAADFNPGSHKTLDAVFRRRFLKTMATRRAIMDGRSETCVCLFFLFIIELGVADLSGDDKARTTNDRVIDGSDVATGVEYSNPSLFLRPNLGDVAANDKRRQKMRIFPPGNEVKTGGAGGVCGVAPDVDREGR
uniref:Uncharacterized protein n=1 Tax=Romanomermis culicivorax TaxID=13658 RepID=A0A915I1B1_ROMCU